MGCGGDYPGFGPSRDGLLNAVMNFRVPQRQGDFLTRAATSSLLKRLLRIVTDTTLTVRNFETDKKTGSLRQPYVTPLDGGN